MASKDKIIRVPQPDLVLLIEEPMGPSQLIEIPITANTAIPAKWPLTQELLSDEDKTIVVKGIRWISDKVAATTPGGFTNCPLAEAQNIYVQIWAEGWTKGNMIPLIIFNDIVDADSANASTIPYRNRATKLSNWLKVEWNKNLLVWANGTVPTPPFAVLFLIEYERIGLDGNVIYGPA